MPKVSIKREGGLSIEADLTFEQIKELVGINGYSSPTAHVARKEPEATKTRDLSDPFAPKPPNFDGFYAVLNDNGKAFIKVLREYPAGIEASELAAKMGLKDATQIGGVTGGGLAKHVMNYSISMSDVYRSEITFPGGKRRTMFYPGRLLKGK